MSLFKLSFYVPSKDREIVKTAIFQAGAGKIGNYDCCAWETKGTGQFRPLEGANPHLGKKQSLSFVEEYQVEVVVQSACLQAVIAALLQTHPYETPAYAVWPIYSSENLHELA